MCVLLLRLEPALEGAAFDAVSAPTTRDPGRQVIRVDRLPVLVANQIAENPDAIQRPSHEFLLRRELDDVWIRSALRAAQLARVLEVDRLGLAGYLAPAVHANLDNLANAASRR